ncbi:4Fe-4S dicluster domain-containing protein [Candidatus Kuenenia stuttgartensis]|uniref:4Fe-4S dicluster domain-containing protein n=1 Tax=Kuenenia stuttgartiensis TaxID=174633 RepID=UPI003B969EB4
MKNWCDGCGNCIPACPEQAIQIVETKDGIKAKLVKEFYCGRSWGRVLAPALQVH